MSVEGYNWVCATLVTAGNYVDQESQIVNGIFLMALHQLKIFYIEDHIKKLMSLILIFKNFKKYVSENDLTDFSSAGIKFNLSRLWASTFN